MSDKIMGIVCLALSLLSQVWLPHRDTGELFSWMFGIIGVIQLVIGETRMRQGKLRPPSV